MSDGRIHGILFDLDQTLFDRAAAFQSLVNAELDRVGVPLDRRAEVMREIRAVDRGGYADRRLLLPTLASHFGWQSADLEGTFREALLPHVCLHEGVLATLRRLRRRVRLGLLTDGSTVMQNAKIERLGLGREFDRVQVSGSFGCSKPDPRAFLAFAEEWRLAPESLCMVGDHRERDVDGARQAGLQAAWIGSQGSHPDPEVVHASSVVDLDRHPVLALRLAPGVMGDCASATASGRPTGAPH